MLRKYAPQNIGKSTVFESIYCVRNTLTDYTDYIDSISLVTQLLLRQE